MDESWRISMEPVVPRRRSTEQTRRTSNRRDEDFSDVFGGPPRTVLHHRVSGDFSDAWQGTAFYDEIFRHNISSLERRRLQACNETTFMRSNGRNLPGFRIQPGWSTDRNGASSSGSLRKVRTEEGFYDDIFGSDGGGNYNQRSRDRSVKSKSKSKSNSSSVLSSEDLSPPLRPAIAEDPMLSSFASKLRPITIPSRRFESSPPSTYSGGEVSSHRSFSTINPLSSRCFMDMSPDRGSTADLIRQHQQQQHHRQWSRSKQPPVGQGSSSGDLSDQPGSPSSIISSVVFVDSMTAEPGAARERQCVEKVMVQAFEEDYDDNGEEEEATAERSFVIQIAAGGHGNMGETERAAAVDDAIAWAKEKFWSQTSDDSKEIAKEAVQEGKDRGDI